MIPLLALHGFTQRGRTFDDLAGGLSGPLDAPDLPGHGDSAVPPDLGSTLEWLAELAGAGPRPVLGYSMGGRLALQFALARPDLVASLVLVSASPGIPDVGLRAERRSIDAARAARIHEIGVDAFVDEWIARPMFAGLERRSRDWRMKDRSMRVTNRGAGLAAALRGLGQGALPWVGDRLVDLSMPVLVVAGERDESYVEAARSMAATIPSARLLIVPDAGHSVLGERPAALATAVDDFLSPPAA